ncbi:hypothetical protein FGB62_297g07 [Gracilaria domingensis]|nr:hypothetical protein FGB62_297g07 [Gracilaria domingensis]
MSAQKESAEIECDEQKIELVDKEFEEKYKYVVWSPEEIAQMEELADNGLLEQYLENRREQALIAIGMSMPQKPGTEVKSRSFSVTSRSVSVSDASDFLADVSEIFNVLKKSKIANVFQGLGLVLGCVDFFMTLLNPGQPDPTQELIKECFEKMMTQLSVLATQVDEVKREVQWTAVKNALGESETNIRNALDKYNDFQKQIGSSYEAAYLNDFLEYCTEINLENCMRTLTGAFTSRPTAFEAVHGGLPNVAARDAHVPVHGEKQEPEHDVRSRQVGRHDREREELLRGAAEPCDQLAAKLH